MRRPGPTTLILRVMQTNLSIYGIRHWVHQARETRHSTCLSRVTGHYFGVYTCVSSVEHEARTDVRVLGLNLFVTSFQDPSPPEDDPQ